MFLKGESFMKNYMKALEQAITEIFFDMVRYKKSYEWIKYSIESEEGNTSWSIKTDYESVTIELASTGAVWLTLGEFCHHNVDVKLASEFVFDNDEKRTVDDILADIKTLTGVFLSGDMHHYMYVLNLFAPYDNPVLQYHGAKSWRLAHEAYKESKE